MADIIPVLALGYKTSVLHNKMSRDVLEKYDLTSHERDILLFLNSKKVDTSIGIVKYLMISKPLVSKAVGSLIARGYIEGERDKEDKRCIHLKILPKGRPIVDEVKAAWDKYLSVLMSGITEDELASLYETISKISNNADIHLNNNYSDMD